MTRTIKLLATVSRPEFLPANLGSLVMGSAWAINSSSNLNLELAATLIFAFAIITVVSAIGAQLNSLSDYELDNRDVRKRYLVEAMDKLGRNKLKKIIAVEFLISSVLTAFLLLIHWRNGSLLIWMTAIFLAYVYSMPPLRLKSRSWLAMISLITVLSFLPIFFVYYNLATQIEPLFFLFLIGQSLTVYGLIVPTEIRDYWGDKAMNVETLTVHLGLKKAALFGIALLILGGIFSASAFSVAFIMENKIILSTFLLAMAAAHGFALKQYGKLRLLCKKHELNGNSDSWKQEIIELSAHNPQWITVVSQAIVIVSLVLLASRLLL